MSRVKRIKVEVQCPHCNETFGIGADEMIKIVVDAARAGGLSH